MDFAGILMAVVVILTIAAGFLGYPWWIAPIGTFVTVELYFSKRTMALRTAWLRGGIVRLVVRAYLIHAIVLGIFWLIGLGIAHLARAA